MSDNPATEYLRELMADRARLETENKALLLRLDTTTRIIEQNAVLLKNYLERALTAESRLGDGSKRMLEFVEKHHEVIAERDSALLRLDSADQAVKLSKVAYRMAEERAKAAERERDLAVAHDLQPYPTAEAYEKACEALHSRGDEVKTLKVIVEALAALPLCPMQIEPYHVRTHEWVNEIARLRNAALAALVVERQKS